MKNNKPKQRKYFSLTYCFYFDKEGWVPGWSEWHRLGYCADYRTAIQKFFMKKFECRIHDIRSLPVKSKKNCYGVRAVNKKNTITPIIAIELKEEKVYNSKTDRILSWFGLSIFHYEK
jgi:hypothetical protein